MLREPIGECWHSGFPYQTKQCLFATNRRSTIEFDSTGWFHCACFCCGDHSVLTHPQSLIYELSVLFKCWLWLWCSKKLLSDRLPDSLHQMVKQNTYFDPWPFFLSRHVLMTLSLVTQVHMPTVDLCEFRMEVVDIDFMAAPMNLWVFKGQTPCWFHSFSQATATLVSDRGNNLWSFP